MKSTMKQHTIKVGVLLLGLRQRLILDYLQAHGFTEADLEEGWRLFNMVGRMRRGSKGSMIDKELLSAMDRFENYWFPIVRIALERHYPAFEVALFEGLGRSKGKAASWNVGFFLDRLQLMEAGEAPFGADGPAARELLAKRGLTSEVIASVTASLEAQRSTEAEREVDLSEEERSTAETAMLAWYKEWAGIALQVIPNRNILRSLGLRRRGRQQGESAVEETESAPHLITDGGPVLALPAGSGTPQAAE